jgi:cytochrome c-type biogenesis protein CcmH/NrfG
VAQYWLCQVYRQSADRPNHLAQAELHLQESVRLSPDMAEGHYELGRVYVQGGQRAKAEAAFRRSVALDPSNESALFDLSQCLLQEGKTEEGQKLALAAEELGTAKRQIKELQRRAIVQPKDPEPRLRLARLYRKYENVQGAVAGYQEYLKLAPSDAAVAREYQDYVAAHEKELGGAPPAAPAGR